MEFLEHDTNEPKIDRKFPAPWKLVWPLIAFFWLGNLYLHGLSWFNWGQIVLALGTGCMLAAWAIEVTGNKVPDSWRSKSRR